MLSVRSLRGCISIVCTLLCVVPTLYAAEESFAASPNHALVLEQLKNILIQGREDGIHLLNASQFELNNEFYGPVQLECAELSTGSAESESTTLKSQDTIETVLSWSAPGWAPEGINAGLSIRSITKFFVNVALLELEKSGVGPSRNALVKDFFPECAQDGNLLKEATVEQLMHMLTKLDYRTHAFDASTNLEFPESKWGAPGSHPCELAGISHADCVRKLICPAYSHTNVFEAVRMNPDVFGSNGLFTFTKAPFIDARCGGDSDMYKELCPQWALYGYCHKNPAFMLAKCAGSCRVCDIVLDGDNLCADSAECASVFEGYINNMYHTLPAILHRYLIN